MKPVYFLALGGALTVLILMATIYFYRKLELRDYTVECVIPPDENGTVGIPMMFIAKGRDGVGAWIDEYGQAHITCLRSQVPANAKITPPASWWKR